MEDNGNHKTDVERLTEKINALFENDEFYTSAKMEGYLSKVGDIEVIAREVMDKYKEEHNINGELAPEQVEEVAVKFDEELKKSIEMDRVSKEKINRNDNVNEENGKEEEEEEK